MAHHLLTLCLIQSSLEGKQTSESKEVCGINFTMLNFIMLNLSFPNITQLFYNLIKLSNLFCPISRMSTLIS